MPEETTPADAQAANAGDTSAQAATQPTPDAQAADGQETITLEEARRLRSESKALRDRLHAAETKSKELDDLKKQIEEEKLSAQEKLEKRLAEAQKEREQALLRAQEGIVNAEIKAEMAAQGLKNFRLARLVDRERIEFDGNGNPTNIGALVDDLLKDMPELKSQAGSQQSRQAASSGGATNPSRSQSGQPQALSDEVIAKMTPQEYEARRPEIQAYRFAHPFRYGQKR